MMDSLCTLERVISGLQCKLNEGGKRGCSDCPYDEDFNCLGCDVMLRDALTLLKALEPVEPILDIDEWKCGVCGHKLEHQELLGENVLFHEQYNYCPDCGRAVMWK